MTVPVLKTFIKQNPNVKVTIVSKPFLKPLFTDIKNVAFYSADVTNKHKGFFGIVKLFTELKALGFTEVADLHNVLRSKILRTLFQFSFIKVAAINKGRKEKKALTRSKNKIFKQLKTTHQRYADVFLKLGYFLNIEEAEFLPKKELHQALLKITGNKVEKWIGIAPFAQYAGKMYPLDLMKTVIKKLSAEKNIKILLFGGGKKEIEQLTAIEHQFKNTINIAGNLTLPEELALISNLDVMLSMDSGNAHFAAMFGVKTITLWGVTHPFTGFAPFSQPEDFAMLPDLTKYPNIPCSVYGNKVCDGYEDVMRTITPEKVVAKILKVIQ